MENFYSIKELIAKPIVTKINSQEEVLRNEIMNDIIENQRAFPAAKGEKQNRILEMERKNILKTNGKGEVEVIYPLSALPTDKKVILEDGRVAYAMCAIDALGFHYAFRQNIRIESRCEYCGHDIVLEVNNGVVKVLKGGEHIYVLHTDLENMTNWSCCCCNIMHFFDCEEFLEKWAAEKGVTNKMFKVDLETANKIAWLLFSN